MKLRVICLLVCVLIFFTSCSAVADKVSSALDSTGAVKSETGSVSPVSDAAGIQKYNAYIEFLNYQSGWYSGMLQIYFNTFGAEEELQIGERFDGFTLSSSEIDVYEYHKDKSKSPRSYAEKKPSYGEADEKILVLCDAFDSLMALYFSDINKYYTDKEYENDDFAKGREFHRKMLESCEVFADANHDFTMAFMPTMLEAEGSELPMLKDEGYFIHYYSLSLILDGRRISNMFQNLEYEGIDFLEADLEEYEKLYNSFTENLTEFKKYYSDNAQMEKEGIKVLNASFLNKFASTADQMMVAATDTYNMIKAGTTKIDNELTGKATTGGRNYPPGRFDDRLERLIGDYNQFISL